MPEGVDLALDVFRPGDASFVGVFLSDLVAVSEHFSDEGSRDFGNECLSGGVG
jgi:hypothetical protein